jgi:DHA1 family bicyclomycin/chloramphenicol resistance-like MFS transporter
LRLALILGALAAFAPLSTDMYLPSLPALAREFAAGAGTVQLTLAAFFLGFALGQAFYGALSDRYGRKPLLNLGLLLYVGASAGCAAARNIDALIALRFAQGLGGCAGVVIARAVVRDLFDFPESARMYSLLLLIMGIAPIVAPLLGGWILVTLGWRAIFWTLALFGAVCLGAAARALGETHPASAERPSLGALMRGYLTILRHRAFLRYTLASTLGMAGMFAYISGSPFVFIEVYGVPAHAYGWLFGTNALGLAVASQINRRLLRRVSAERLLARAVAINAGVGPLLFAAVATGLGGFPVILALLFCYIATLGFSFPNAIAGAMAPFPARAGAASALFGTVQFVLAAVAGALVGQLHDGSAVPMAAVIALFGASALVAQRLLASR